jgi:hypothetical protein
MVRDEIFGLCDFGPRNSVKVWFCVRRSPRNFDSCDFLSCGILSRQDLFKGMLRKNLLTGLVKTNIFKTIWNLKAQTIPSGGLTLILGTQKWGISCKIQRHTHTGLKSSHWACVEAFFKGYTFCFTTFLVTPSTGAQRGHERPPKNGQMTLKDQSFVNRVKVSFLCIPEVVWPSNFGNCLRMPQR